MVTNKVSEFTTAEHYAGHYVSRNLYAAIEGAIGLDAPHFTLQLGAP